VTDRLWIVLVNYNGLDDTRRCLQSLVVQTVPVSIVVVDNASRVDPAGVLASEFPGVEFIQTGCNGGWAGGNNAGLRHALARGARLIVLLNNDTVVSENFAARLLAATRQFPEYGILGPIIRYMDPPWEVQTDGVVFNRPGRPGFFQRFVVPVTATDPPTIAEVDIVNGCCLLVRREVVEKIGFIDEAFFLIHEESDFCLRAQDAGFKNGVIAEALVWHKGSSSFQREGKRLQRYFDARNLIRLLSRHGHRSGSRGWWRSILHHVHYSYHRYSAERERGYPDSAKAVLEGLYDGLIGRYGPTPTAATRAGLWLLQAIFAGAWWLKRGRIGVDPITPS